MHREFDAPMRRDTRFAETYSAESARMHCPPPQPEKRPEQQPARDAAVILPLLILLMTEGADRYLLLALLYILM